VNEKWVTVNYLDSDVKYEIKLAPSGKIIAKAPGKEPGEKGFMVIFEGDFEGELYEVVQAE